MPLIRLRSLRGLRRIKSSFRPPRHFRIQPRPIAVPRVTCQRDQHHSLLEIKLTPWTVKTRNRLARVYFELMFEGCSALKLDRAIRLVPDKR
jgi:hypothetical protein